MDMSLKFKSFFLILFVVSNFCYIHAQEVPSQDESIEDEFEVNPETVFFNLEIFRPVAIGNYALAKDYTMSPGVAFDFNWFALPELTLGTHISITGGTVNDPSRIGNISNTTIYLLGIDIGYYYAFDKEWNIHASAGYGILDYRHSAPQDKFSEQGNSFWLQVQLGYRINRTIAVYFKLQPRYDKLNIAAPSSIDRYINNQIIINPGLGFRINLQNPGG